VHRHRPHDRNPLHVLRNGNQRRRHIQRISGIQLN
jgi:hypothetical protein